MTAFADALVAWQQAHGRHNLPWQNTQNPYRVWLSEIMLQQTQVATVLPYYRRFLQTFPTVFDLAQAPLDSVLGLWSGLGYYSRARNLHQCAKQVVQQHQGHFPRTAESLQTLPGIGASTAAAIAAFCFGQRVCIFDANVQRVMARQFAYAGDVSRVAHKRSLHKLAHSTLPKNTPPNTTMHRQMIAYTQGLMDLGAMVCKSKQPACGSCPVAWHCKAHRSNTVWAYPHKKARQTKTTEHWWLLALHSPQQTPAICLQQRQATGIWAGLYCFPVFANAADMYSAIRHVQPNFSAVQFEQAVQSAFVLRHVLTHKILHLHIVCVAATEHQPLNQLGSWYTQWQQLGLPAPIRKWLQQNTLR